MPDQLPLPFHIDQDSLTAFLDRAIALEDEMDRLREEMRVHQHAYTELLPMRAVATAVKIVRARQKLEQHHKEPLPLGNQLYLEDLVAQHFAMLEAARVALAKATVAMLTGEHSES